MDVAEAVLNSGMRLLVPLLLAALGELISERAGVMNIGLEGYMAMGAFGAFAVAASGLSIPVAVIVAACAGALIACVMAVAAVWLRGNAILVGFAIFILAPGLANFLFVQKGSLGSTPELAEWSVPLLSQMPFIGSVLFSGNIFYWMTVLAVVLVYLFFARSTAGLVVTATGHDPEAVRKRGMSPRKIQTVALLACGALAGLGGAALSLGVSAYQPDLIGGRGLIAIAIVILGRWTVAGAVGGALLVAILDALRLRVSYGSDIPVQLLGALPWVVVIMMLLASQRMRSHAPRTLTT